MLTLSISENGAIIDIYFCDNALKIHSFKKYFVKCVKKWEEFCKGSVLLDSDFEEDDLTMKTVLPFPQNDAHFTLLIASQDEDLAQLLSWAVEPWGVRVVCVDSVAHYGGRADAILVDWPCEGEDRFACLAQWKMRWADIPVIELVDDWQSKMTTFSIIKPFSLNELQAHLATLLPAHLAEVVNG